MTDRRTAVACPWDIVCGASALCVCLAGDTLLVANRAAAIKAALAVADGHAPGLGLSAAALRTADLVWADGPDIAAALSHSVTLLSGHGAEPHEVAARAEPVLAFVRTLGPLLTALEPTATGRLSGEVRAP